MAPAAVVAQQLRGWTQSEECGFIHQPFSTNHYHFKITALQAYEQLMSCCKPLESDMETSRDLRSTSAPSRKEHSPPARSTLVPP